MRYTNRNTAARCSVFDVDAKQEIRYVREVNTKEGWLVLAKQPVRTNAHGSVECERVRYRSIYPIYGGKRMPVMFHCYGRLDAAKT